MITQRLDGVYLYCDKPECKRMIRQTSMISKKFIDKYSKKRIFCGRCIQKRLHRGEYGWSYDEEFAYVLIPLDDEEKESLNETLELLNLFI